MAISTKLCLNLSPQPPPTSNYNSIPPLSKTSQVSWQRKEKSWKSQCVLGMACIVIGLELDSSILGNQEITAIAAGDMQIHVVTGNPIKKWSEKRSCPPWNGNSLETIVPENLPRPVTRRRWEAVDYNTTTQSAPAVKLMTKFSKGCFTM